MTEAIVLVPGVLAWWVAQKQSLAEAFLQVFIPVLLILPDYYTLPIDHFPDPSFIQACILPIGIGLCWKELVKRRWKFTFLDLTVTAYFAWQIVCEVYNTGFTKMPDLIFDLLTLGMFPYMAGKVLIEQYGLRVKMAKQFVFMVFLVCVLSVYEFRMGVSLFRPTLGPFFPGQTPEWVTQLRWGFGRIAGPYGHAISMCVFVGFAYLLHRWLQRSGLWERNFKMTGTLPVSKTRILGIGLLAGMFMTLSRGPWLGVLCGVVLASVGLQKNRGRALKRSLLILVAGGAILYFAGKAYLANASAFEGVEEQASAAYRAILISQYEDIVMISPVFGWGRANWPQVEGMKSIDNNYLFVALGTGLVGLGLLTAMFLTGFWKIFWSGYRRGEMPLEERTFRFTLAAILLSIAISTGTTYISAHMYPMFFLLLGWSETCAALRESSLDAPSLEQEESMFALMRVVA